MNGYLAHIIVGIDPGKTSGIACLALDGKLIMASHKTGAGVEWMVSQIREIGTPSVIATDKKHPSSVARKLNSIFNSRLMTPQKDISMEEKRRMSKGTSISNPHERDAYSAALKAYNAMANKLNQAEHISRAMNVDDTDSIKAKVFNKYSISEAIQGKKANR